MWWKIGFACSVLLWTSVVASFAQQNTPQQPALQRDDPATSGAGPTSRAPGQYNYDSPKDGPVTTDSRGVTTNNSKAESSKPEDVPLDQGNESFDVRK
jgi:hypothetical protein